jgi:hypothetical protein
MRECISMSHLIRNIVSAREVKISPLCPFPTFLFLLKDILIGQIYVTYWPVSLICSRRRFSEGLRLIGMSQLATNFLEILNLGL